MDRRWIKIALGITANICLGTVYSWSVFREPLMHTYGFTVGQSGIPYSVFLGAFAFSMPFGGRLLTRRSPRFAMTLGAVLVGLGWISAGFVTSLPALIVTYGIIGGIGVGMTYGVPLAVAGSWYPDRRGFAVGLTLFGFGLSPFITAPLAEILIQWQGVARTFVILGASFTVVLLAISPFMRRAHGTVERGGYADTPGDVPPGRMVKRREFFGLWIAFALATFGGLTTIGLSAAYGIEIVGIRPGAAATAVAGFGICNGLGRPLFGWITDHLGARRTSVLAFAVIILGSVIILVGGTGRVASYLAGFALLWLLLGGWLAIAPAATVDFFGTHHYASNYGIMYTAYGVGALAGGSVSGLLTSLTGTLLTTFWATIAAAVVGIVVTVTLLPSPSADR